MIGFTNWCDVENASVGAHGHILNVLAGRPADLAHATQVLAAVVPSHYASEEHIARNLELLGKDAAAAFIREKLPTSKKIRSGDLGEILATEYIAETTPFTVPIKRLRWKDHRNMAMRGDDVIGIQTDPESGQLRFLKAEAKSRVNLTAAVVSEARDALDKDSGLPSAHALSFISERLFEAGNRTLADAIDNAMLIRGITPAMVNHLLFTFSGNDPTALVRTSLESYLGAIPQNGIALRIAAHANFVHNVYEKAMNGDNH